MFDGKYFEWNQKRIKAIVDHYGYKFFYSKKILDLGCGYADLSGVLYRLGADITAVDARQEHLKIVSRKFPGIKVVRANLEDPWPFFGQKFDIVMDIGLLCHLPSFEEHLKAVCASATHLILETAVCDSDDPTKLIRVEEGKDIYDLAYGGMGCRPSATNIERILLNCGMTFKRIDSSKLNSSEYVYDWLPRNDNSANLNKRRMWFVSKTAEGLVTPHIGVQPAVVVQPPQSVPNFLPQPGPSTAILTAIPRPPLQSTFSGYTDHKASVSTAQVAKNSREFSLITPETYPPPLTFDTGGVIWPITLSSKMWLKKIAPLFPNLKVHNRAVSMPEFNKSDSAPNVVMCSINRIVPAGRVWIEEWSGTSIDSAKTEILKQCQVIMTPSLVNAQEILKALPNANIQRVQKTWPLLQVNPNKTGNFIYFEKEEDVTDTLFQNWNDKFGKLIVVGTRLKTPEFVENILDTADYSEILKLLAGSRAIIDISHNNYYMSGILGLSAAISLPIITNNQYYLNNGASVIIEEINMSSVKFALDKFLDASSSASVNYNSNYNQEVNLAVKKMVGV